jgi:AraC-like DNA-binding protein
MKPCPSGLAMSKVPAKRWETREDVLKRLEEVRSRMWTEPTARSLEDLASEAMLSPFHFQRVFKATYGKSPHAYLREARLQRAYLLLSLRQMNVSAACVEVGFVDVASFCRLYRKRFGYSPGRTPAKWSSPS